MDVQDQQRIVRSSWISHFQYGIVSTIGVSFGVLPECSGKSDHLGFGTCCSDCIDGCLSGGCPLGSIEVMGLVHDTKDDPRLASILLSKQAPNTSKVLITRSALAHHTPVPPGVIVEIQHGISTRLEHTLDQSIVFGQEGLVERGGSLIVSNHVLPSEGESEEVGSL